MEYTQNYNLKKPEQDDFYNVEDFNENADIIDQKLKEAMEKAEQAFQSASNGKTGIAAVIGEPADSGDTFAQLAEHISNAKAIMADNLTLKGVIAQATESLSALAAKIANIVRGGGNAKPEDVLAGKTFSNDDGPNQVGTMPNNGPSTAETITLTTQNQEYTIAKGYHTGLRKVKVSLNDIGSLDTTLTISGSGKPSKSFGAGYTPGGAVTAQLDPNLAQHIREGITIGGVPGALKPFVTAIKSIQRGLIDRTIPGTDPPTKHTFNITVNAVDPSKSIVLVRTLSDANTRPSVGVFICQLVNATTLQFTNQDGSVLGGKTKGSWQLIEFNPELVKSVQRGVIQVGARNLTEYTVTINAVNPAKSILIVNNNIYYTTDVFYLYGYGEYYGELKNSTTVSIRRPSSYEPYDRFSEAAWEVIEFY